LKFVSSNKSNVNQLKILLCYLIFHFIDVALHILILYNNFFSQRKQLLSNRVFVTVIFEMLLQHNLVIGLSGGHNQRILIGLLNNIDFTYVIGSIMKSFYYSRAFNFSYFIICLNSFSIYSFEA